jgi:hypothetical protein
MTTNEFIKRNYYVILRVLAAVALSAVTAAFIWAFKNGWLPYAEDGNAFDTVYAIESEE